VSAALTPEPARDCPLCPRLVAYRAENARQNPDWWNGPAPSFGDPNARLLIAGLAPGRTGASAGWILYETLLKTGFATGVYEADPNDSLQLRDCMITNAVRCAPPQNKPTATEENTCRPFLVDRLAALPRLKVIVTLGDVSRRSILRTLGYPGSAIPAGHGVEGQVGPYTLINSYHCSRLNTNTGRLTAEMFEDIFKRAKAALET